MEIWLSVIGILATVLFGLPSFIIALRQQSPAPLLRGERSAGKTTVRNLGSTPALDVVSLDERRHARHVASAIAPEQSAELAGLNMTLTAAHYVYYEDVSGRSYRTKLVGRSLGGREQQFPIGSTSSRVASFRVPRPVKSLRRTATRSAVEHLEALSSYFTFEAWWHRAKHSWKLLRLWIGPKWWGLGETRRLRKYAKYADDRPAVGAGAEERAGWELDLTGLTSGCWHTSPRRVEQLSHTAASDGTLACLVRVRCPFDGSGTDGLLVVPPRSRKRLLTLSQADRNRRAWNQLSQYVCGLRPKTFFVCEI